MSLIPPPSPFYSFSLPPPSPASFPPFLSSSILYSLQILQLLFFSVHSFTSLSQINTNIVFLFFLPCCFFQKFYAFYSVLKKILQLSRAKLFKNIFFSKIILLSLINFTLIYVTIDIYVCLTKILNKLKKYQLLLKIVFYLILR